MSYRKMQDFAEVGDAYSRLYVTPNAPHAVISAAYKARMKEAHPDVGGSDSISSAVNQAYAVLKDPSMRQEYDNWRRNQETTIGNYTVLEQISEGAMGYTYKAEHSELKELACLKQNIHVTPEDVDIFRREAKLLWNIHHHSLPTLRDFFIAEDGSAVLAMTYIEGPSIDQIVEKCGPIDAEHVCWMTQRLLNALHYLHFHGIVHCDVKPNNIIIVPEEHNAVLVDYGFASFRPRHTTKPEGYTQAFAAPELIALKPPIPATDLYSLAKTMVYALGGNPLTNEYPPGVPVQIQQFFDAFLDEDPRKRPDWDARDLVKDLSDIREEVFGRRVSGKPLEVPK